MKTLYTAHAKTIGGRHGHSETDDKHLNLELAPPGLTTSKPGNTTNPEQLFACGYSACFGSAVEFVAKQQNIAVNEAQISADVGLNQDDSGFFITVTLNVAIPGVDQATTEQLTKAAHQVCPYSKATRGNITVTLQANGKTLS
jgi:Ohr subfamily peroxiredoxin